MDQENLEQQVENKPQEPSIEDLAREKGWKPKEEYEGDIAHWRSAEVFMALDEPLKRIESLGKELKNTKKTMQALQEHHVKVKEAEFKRAIEYLKNQKKEAHERGDVDAIIEIDDKLATVREQQQQQKQETAGEQASSGSMEEFNRWVDDNKWYSSDEELRDYADMVGHKYHSQNPDKSPTEVLVYVSKRVKETFKDKFENKNRSKPSAVDGGERNANKKGSDDFDIELSDNERKVMMNFVRNGIMTKAEYIKEVKLLREQGR
jgi:hypothetical protein